MKSLAMLALTALAIVIGVGAFAAQPKGAAYVDVAKLQAMAPLQAQLDAYDREIAALEATQSVPQLADTRGVVRKQAQVVKAGAAEARDTLNALRLQPKAPSGDAYRNAIAGETTASLVNFKRGLDARVASAVAARQQQFTEHEAQLEIQLERAVADRRLVLAIKLQNLKSPYADRPRLRAEIDAMDAQIARRVDGLRAADARALASYRAQLESQAAAQYATTASEMQRNARANLQLHGQVARGEASVPASGRLVKAQAFDAAGADISRRFNQIADGDAAARGDAANQIVALQRDKGALREEFRRSVIALATSIANARGLTLVDRPQPGAVDLTSEVAARL